jgi:hypothetical protein
MDDFVSKYLGIFALDPHTKLKKAAFATYDLLGVSEENPKESSLSVQFMWEEPPAVLSPPPYSSNAVLRVRKCRRGEAGGNCVFCLHAHSFPHFPSTRI